jgi:hypothetical protein
MEGFLKTLALLQQKQPRQKNTRMQPKQSVCKPFQGRGDLSPHHSRDCKEQKANVKLKHCFRLNAVLDIGLEVRLVDNTYLVCKDGKMIIPKPLQRCTVLWYHHYLQHPGHTRLEETMKATMY